MERTEGTVRAGDVTLRYQAVGGRAEGDGFRADHNRKAEPLVLLHGNGESLEIFAGMAEALAERFPVVALDTRGHGQSTRGDKPMCFETFAEDLLSALDALGLERVHLLGFSDGGNTALAFAAAHPERLRSLITVGANLSPGGIRRGVQSLIALGYRTCGLLAPFSQRARRNREILGLMVNHPHMDPAALGVVSCPALVVAGERDIVLEAETRRIAESLPRARLELLPGADHDIPGKFPRELVRLLLDFVDE